MWYKINFLKLFFIFYFLYCYKRDIIPPPPPLLEVGWGETPNLKKASLKTCYNCLTSSTI